MNLQEEFSKIIESEDYKEFKKENPDSFLANVFLDKDGWQFNFSYDKKMISFYLQEDVIKTEESEVYEKNSQLEELKLKEIKIDLEKAENLIKAEEEITKKIIILQQKEVPLWNITYITSSMDVINVRINAISGEIIKQNTENILNFKATQ